MSVMGTSKNYFTTRRETASRVGHGTMDDTVARNRPLLGTPSIPALTCGGLKAYFRQIWLDIHSTFTVFVKPAPTLHLHNSGQYPYTCPISP